MKHLELAGYFDKADFRVDGVTWTLNLHFVESYGDGSGYQFTADFVGEPPEKTVSNVTVCVPKSETFARDRVIAHLHAMLADGTLASESTVTCAAEPADA